MNKNLIVEKFNDILASHPFAGWIVALIILLVGIFVFLGRLIPNIDLIRARILLPIAKKIKHKRLSRAAIKSDICGQVNSAVVRMEDEFPGGWFQKTEIEWIEHENREDFLDNDELVLRMRPVESQDKNYITALYYYMKKSIFPKTKNVIPKNHYEATVLFLSQRIISSQKPCLINIFEDCILEPKVEKQVSILNNIEKYNLLDGRGFFASFFLREAHDIARKFKLTSERASIGSEIADLLKHGEKFINSYSSKDHSDSDWIHIGKLSSYGFLLVANPSKALESIFPYINRAKERFSSNIKRLYIFGTKEERWFAEIVIKGIEEKVVGYELAEVFNLSHDYRGGSGGIGALFVLKEI